MAGSTVTTEDTATNESKKNIANTYASPSVNAAQLIMKFNPGGDIDFSASVEDMREKMSKIHKGDIAQIESMLLAQAYSLQAIFTNCAHRMAKAEYLNQLKVNGALAFKAQSQCRQTLASLADIKNPKRATFIKNTATNQQINVHKPNKIAEKNSFNSSNKLISEGKDATMDTGGTGAAGATNKELAAVENSRG